MIKKQRKQSLVISAYKDKDNLYKIIEWGKDYFNIFIHIDKRSKVYTKQDIINLNMIDGVMAILKYRIVWGGMNHLYALLEISKLAINYTIDNGYIHLISGQDLPLKSTREFDLFFSNKDTLFLGCEEKITFNNIVNERWMYWNLFPKFDGRKRYSRCLRKISIIIQKKLGIKRKQLGNFENLGKGLVWCSLPKQDLNYAIDYLEKNKSFKKDLEKTFIPEEFFFQSIFINTVSIKKRISNINLRFSEWIYRNGSIPAYLDMNDYNKVMNGDFFFARKVDSNISSDLITNVYLKIM